MEIEIIGDGFCICKVGDISEIDFSGEYVFLGKTDEELSLVCSEKSVPEGAKDVSRGYSALRFKGVLDFSLVGILSKAAGILGKEGISIFAISTYNTDYILIKTSQKEKAIKALRENGYIIA